MFCRGSGETLRKELAYDGHAENFQKNVLLPHNTQEFVQILCYLCTVVHVACLRIGTGWRLFLQYEFYQKTHQHLPVHLLGYSQYLVVPV